MGTTMRNVLLLLAAFGLASASGFRRAVPEYIINLDKEPSDRYTALIPKYNASVWDFYNSYFAKDKVLLHALYKMVDTRGQEVEELQDEIYGLAKGAGLPFKFVHGVQLLY